MRKNKHTLFLKAFTIMELLVVMGVAGLLISASYFILTQFNSFFHQQSKDQESILAQQSIYSQLSYDFFGSQEVRLSGRELTAIYRDHSVVYELDRAGIVRDFIGVKDSLEVQELTLESVLISESNDKGLIRNLHLNFEQDGVVYRWSFSKTYGAAYLVNYGD